jgi:phospholipase/carboxylesterase
MTRLRVVAALALLAGPGCGPEAPSVPCVDPSREEPSREAFGGVEFLTYFERSARTSSPLIVALHGRGETPPDFAPVWRDFPAKVEIALPRAPLRYADGLQWFDWPPGMTDDALAEAVSAAEAKLWPAIAAVARGRKIILAGFSQGAVVAYAMALRHPDEIACAFPIAGRLPAKLLPHGHVRAAPVYALHGTDDPAISVEAARDVIAALAAAGTPAELHEFAGTGHTISPAMRDDLITQVRAVAANLERYPRRDPGAATTSAWIAPAQPERWSSP